MTTKDDKGVIIPFGKYKGDYIEKLLINRPGYIDWLLRQNMDNKFTYIIEHIKFCMSLFDDKPFLVKCFGKDHQTNNQCNKYVEKISLYSDNIEPYYWCKDCDPYQLGAYKALTIISSYREALSFIHNWVNNSNPSFIYLINEIAEAKGLKGRKTKSNIMSFFYN